MLKGKRILCAGLVVLTVVLFAFVAGKALALNANYNRPNPCMDYVPQELGIYDTMYCEHTEHNCRKCHGSSTADRHHNHPWVVRDHLCTPCHAVIPDPPGVIVIRDCLTSGCHSWDDVRFGNKRWHHNTDMAASENCVACHDPRLIEEITPFRDFQMYPSSVVTPTPFSCENCHWEQPHSTTGNPNAPGHPSTYDHYDAWGACVGFFEYCKPIYGNFDTHHMEFNGFAAGQCYKCHSQDPDDPDWDPYNPELIRYCEICHSIGTLHTIGPHVSPHPGWLPVGFHAGGGGPNPNTYATWDYNPCKDPDGPGFPKLPQVKPGFTTDQQCFCCHGDAVPPWTDTPPANPWILEPDVVIDRLFGISPTHGSCGAIVVIRGENFGAEHIPPRAVQLRPTAGGSWISVPIHAWTDTRIEWELPCWTFAPGNYRVRVKTELGTSNVRIFTVEDHQTLLSASVNGGPARGPCGVWIKLLGNGFDSVQTKIYTDGYHGVHHVVDFVASSGIYTATNYKAATWTDTNIDVRFYDLFEDQIDNCGRMFCTPEDEHMRNFVQDIGDETGEGNVKCDNLAPYFDECPLEPIIPRCDCMPEGKYLIYAKTIYFGDEDGDGKLSCGDTIFQVEKSDPVQFELTTEPIIYKLNPRKIERFKILKVYGLNFGTVKETGDAVRIGTKAQAEDLVTPGLGRELPVYGTGWSMTLIKVKVSVPRAWEGKTKYVWVEKGGMKSNYKPLRILAPLP